MLYEDISNKRPIYKNAIKHNDKAIEGAQNELNKKNIYNAN